MLFQHRSFRRISYYLCFLCIVGGLVSFSTIGQANQALSIEDGLVLWLPMDEGSGVDAFDETDNDNDGTIIGGIHWIEGSFWQRSQFDQSRPCWLRAK